MGITNNGHSRPYRHRYNRINRNKNCLVLSRIQYKRKRIRLQQKKADELEKENNIYKTFNLLNQNIFTPLKNNIITTFSNNYFIPNIKFDPLDICESGYFEEGYKHLVKDIEGFDDDFEFIKKSIIDYNEDLKKFEDKELDDLISKYFAKTGFNITLNPNIPNEDNTIVLTSEFKQILKRYWYEEGYSFSHQLQDGYLKINNTITIAKTSKDIEEINNCIEGIKINDEILSAHKNLIDIFSNIKDKSTYLSKMIEKKTIMPIEKGRYATTCEECIN